MRNKVNRIVIDTNLWISFLISKKYEQLDLIILSAKVKLIFSQELLNEFLEVVSRPKLRRFFNVDDIEQLIGSIEEFAEFVTVQSKINICRDYKDDFLLSLCVDGKVDYLLTGDKDLLELERVNKTNIVTISHFLNISK